jgi:hypothetical protein
MTRHCELCSKVLECPSRVEVLTRRVVCTTCAVDAYVEVGDRERRDRAERDTEGWWDFDKTSKNIAEGLEILRIKRGHCPQCGLKH